MFSGKVISVILFPLKCDLLTVREGFEDDDDDDEEGYFVFVECDLKSLVKLLYTIDSEYEAYRLLNRQRTLETAIAACVSAGQPRVSRSAVARRREVASKIGLRNGALRPVRKLWSKSMAVVGFPTPKTSKRVTGREMTQILAHLTHGAASAG